MRHFDSLGSRASSRLLGLALLALVPSSAALGCSAAGSGGFAKTDGGANGGAGDAASDGHADGPDDGGGPTFDAPISSDDARTDADASLLDGAPGDGSATDGAVGMDAMGAMDAMDAAESGPPPLFYTMKISPGNPVAFIDTSAGSAATLTYAASLVDSASGTATDVTASTVFSLGDPSLGSFAGASFTSALALPGGALGVTTGVVGHDGTNAATGKLTLVKLRKTPDSKGARDFFFTVPYKAPPTPPSDVLKFATNIKKVDVAILMDTTGSMGGEINNLKSTLTGSIVPALVAAIPDVGIAVVDHKDSDAGDPWTANVLQVVTTDISAVSAAIGTMSASGGGDLPEAQIAAMLFTLTGTGNFSANPPIAAHASPPGYFGGVDFRPGAVPVIVQISDASWHDPSGDATLGALEAAFTAQNAKYVGIHIDLGGSDSSIPQGTILSDATGSNLPPAAMPGGTCPSTMTSTGNCRLNFLASSDGTGVDTSVVGAINAIAVGSVYDVRAVLSNDPSNPGGVDATQFVAQVRAMDEGSAGDGCAPHDAYDATGKGYKDTFRAVTVGSPVCFQVVAKQNDTVPATPSAQFFNAFIDMVGVPGSVDLGDRRTVIFLVPPTQ